MKAHGHLFMPSFLVLSCTFLLTLGGCCVVYNLPQATTPQLRQFFAVTTAPAEPGTASVLYGTFEKPGRFLIGCYVGNDSERVTNVLVNTGIQQVSLESGTETERHVVDQLEADLIRAGIEIVPVSALPATKAGCIYHNKSQVAAPLAASIIPGTWIRRDDFFLSVHAERTMAAVTRKLRDAGINKIIFHSEFKFSPENVKEFNDLVESAGLRIEQFWIPRGTYPGLVDLKAITRERPEQKENN